MPSFCIILAAQSMPAFHGQLDGFESVRTCNTTAAPPQVTVALRSLGCDGAAEVSAVSGYPVDVVLRWRGVEVALEVSQLKMIRHEQRNDIHGLELVRRR